MFVHFLKSKKMKKNIFMNSKVNAWVSAIFLGFGQHIMPPPVGPNQMYNAGNKPMAGMNAVAASASQMGGHFSQYNSQFPGE